MNLKTIDAVGIDSIDETQFESSTFKHLDSLIHRPNDSRNFRPAEVKLLIGAPHQSQGKARVETEIRSPRHT